jgi:hypothetical protein
MYPHLGIMTTCLRDGPGCAARLISMTALDLTAALGPATERDLHRSFGSVAGTPGCRPGRFRNSDAVKVKVKQNVSYSCIRHGLNLLLDIVLASCGRLLRARHDRVRWRALQDDWAITATSSLVASATNEVIWPGMAFNVFLSYSRRDHAAVERVARDISERGRVFLDRWYLTPGQTAVAAGARTRIVGRAMGLPFSSVPTASVRGNRGSGTWRWTGRRASQVFRSSRCCWPGAIPASAF